MSIKIQQLTTEVNKSDLKRAIKANTKIDNFCRLAIKARLKKILKKSR
jgi:hypothetical protein